MSKANLTVRHGPAALGELVQLLAYGQPVGHRTATHVAAQPNAMDGRDRALSLVLIGGGKGGGVLRELQLQPIDRSARVDQTRHALSAGRRRRISAKLIDRLHQATNLARHRRFQFDHAPKTTNIRL